MERLTSGRRHIRAGSVLVTELISKQVAPVEVPGPDATETERPTRPGKLGGLPGQADHTPISHSRPPSKGAQLAKLASLGVASFVLCGSVVYGSMITSQRRDEAQGDLGARPAADISGERALLPDVLSKVVPKTGNSGHTEGGTGQPGVPVLPEEPTGPAGGPGPVEDGQLPEKPVVPPANPPVPAPIQVDRTASKTKLVEQFYRLIPTAPDRAFTLLDGSLLDTELGEFVQAWTSVTYVKLLEVREHGDDVLAVVRMGLSDGSALTVQQLLVVNSGVPRRIIGAQILSAQRN